MAPSWTIRTATAELHEMGETSWCFISLTRVGYNPTNNKLTCNGKIY